MKASAPIVFPIIFGLIGAAVLFFLPDLWFYRSVVDISPRDLAVSGGLFGLGAMRRIAAADVKVMETRQGMSCGQTVYYSVVVVCSNGKRITLGKRLPGAQAGGGRCPANGRSAGQAARLVNPPGIRPVRPGFHVHLQRHAKRINARHLFAQ